MAFQLSPGVNVSEIDLTTIVPAVGTTEGAFVGHFNWGPGNQVVQVTNEVDLVNYLGQPDNNTFVDFYTAANFLAYGRNLKIVRALANTTYTATANGAANIQIKNRDDFEATYSTSTTSNVAGYWAARYPGDLGNTFRVEACPSANAFTAKMVAVATTTATSNVVTFNADPASDANRGLVVGDTLTISNGSVTLANVTVLAINSVSFNVTVSSAVATSIASANVSATWKYAGQFDAAPGTSAYTSGVSGSNDEMHVIVVDEEGKWTGTANTVLEKFAFVSKAFDATLSDGSSNYVYDVIRDRSKYVWPTYAIPFTNTGSTAPQTTFGQSNNKISVVSLGGGATVTPTDGNKTTAYDKFKNADEIDISLVLTGGHSSTVSSYVIDNIAEYRKDCMVFISPAKTDVVNATGSEVNNIITTRNAMTSTSYAVLDSGWKYQFDKYNNAYRWIPLNGDVAGLVVRTDFDRDPWFSPAGFNRGIIKNVVKLAWNPNQSQRDELYKKGINPVVTFAGEGTILYGDKTMLSKPSAFDRINVRRLFIVLEKAIARAAKYSLFEFNDAFTRAQFVALVEPYLRDVQGRRGIFDFRVVCDETNNTPEVIDRNEFIGDIYIKPARSINFIQLNFVAVRTGVSFDEIVGKF